MSSSVLTLALRYLRSRRIALVAVFSIATGVMAMIVVIALMDGVQGFLRDHIKSTQADVVIQPSGIGRSLFADVGRMAEVLEPHLEAAGGPIRAFAPRSITEALIAPGADPGPEHEDLIQGVHLVGIDFDRERAVTPFERMLADVEAESLAVPWDRRDDPFGEGGLPGILLGDALARELRVVRSGAAGGESVVTVVAARPMLESEKPTFDERRVGTFRVAGAFSTGRQDFDGAYAFIDRRELLKLRDQDGRNEPEATSIHVRLVPGLDARAVADELALEHPELLVRSWEDFSQSELLAITDQKRIVVVILSFIIAVAAVAILGIVYLMVVEKTRDIGILRSMGLSRARLVAVFTVYGLTLGLIGAFLGLVVGLQVTAHLDGLVSWLSSLFGVELLNAEIYKFESIPTRVEGDAVMLVLGSAISMSLLASLLPALKAAMMTPVRCLRSD